MKRDDWQERRQAWQSAMVEAARGLDKDSLLKRAMGSVAWGRYNGEPSAGEVKDNIVFGCGYLQGIRDTLLQVGHELNLQGTREFEGIHDRVRLQRKYSS